jgi:hypothetical protein
MLYIKYFSIHINHAVVLYKCKKRGGKKKVAYVDIMSGKMSRIFMTRRSACCHTYFSVLFFFFSRFHLIYKTQIQQKIVFFSGFLYTTSRPLKKNYMMGKNVYCVYIQWLWLNAWSISRSIFNQSHIWW